MKNSLNPDPFDMWRQAVTKLEEGINTLGTQSLKSDEFSKALLEFSTVSMQMQHVMEKALDKYFKAINLPSRKEVMELAETLRRVEDKLDRLLPAPEQPLAPRPARTRRPAAPAVAEAAAPTAPVPTAAAAAVAVAAPKRRRAVGAKRKEA